MAPKRHARSVFSELAGCFRRGGFLQRSVVVLFATALIGFGNVASAIPITITPVTNDAAGASALADAMARNPARIVGASFESAPPGTPNGIGSAGTLNQFPIHGSTFSILTSGDVNLADDPNTSGSSSANLGGAPVRGTTDFDVTILRVDLDVPAGANCLTFNFKFFSEEFPEFVGSAFNDAFIAELDVSDWTTTMSTIVAPNNFSFDPMGNEISVNATGPVGVSPAEAVETTYDAATPLLSASKQVTPGPHQLILSIFDQGDQVFDSAVFLDNLRIGFVPDPAVNCAPGAEPTLFFLDLAPPTAENPVGASHTVTATLTDDDQNPVAGETIGFEVVTGPNAGLTGTAVTDASGMASFTYTGATGGTDTITACFDVNGDGACEATDSAEKVWIEACDGEVATIVGTPGDDTLVGTPVRDVIQALGGDDEIASLGGDDLVCAGTGVDHVTGGRGDDKLLGENGVDDLSGGAGDDIVSGGKGVDELSGNTGDDRLSGKAGADELSAGSGDDKVAGSAGDDELSAGSGDDIVTGNSGDDVLSGQSGDDDLDGGGGTDHCEGGPGTDTEANCEVSFSIP